MMPFFNEAISLLSTLVMGFGAWYLFIGLFDFFKSTGDNDAAGRSNAGLKIGGGFAIFAIGMFLVPQLVTVFAI